MVFSLRASVERSPRAPRCVADTFMTYSSNIIEFPLLGSVLGPAFQRFSIGARRKPCPDALERRPLSSYTVGDLAMRLPHLTSEFCGEIRKARLNCSILHH